jgi:hypothetical protein
LNTCDSFRWTIDTNVPASFPSAFPPHVQWHYCFNPRPNTDNIVKSVNLLLINSGLDSTPMIRLPLHGNLAIPSTHPEAGTTHPLNWAVRVSGLLSQRQMDVILESLDHADDVGCQPKCKSGERTQGLAPHHPGIFFRASQIDRPWISRDLLQPVTQPNARKQGKISPLETIRKDAMIRLIMSVDSVVNGPVQRTLRRVDKEAWMSCHRWVNEYSYERDSTNHQIAGSFVHCSGQRSHRGRSQLERCSSEWPTTFAGDEGHHADASIW